MAISVANLGLGRLFSHDERDKGFTMAALMSSQPEMEKYPRSKYYRSGPVLNQGDTPQCVGYAWRQWLSSGPTVTKGGPLAPAIYKYAQEVDEWPGEDYDGTSVRAGAKVLKTVGCVSSYHWAWSSEEVARWILAGYGPVVLGTNWYDGMFYPTKNGLVLLKGPLIGGHAYVVIGYSRNGDVFTCVNSWGKEWGKQGRFGLLSSDLDRLLREGGEACTAIEISTPG